nr:hypothetical protein [Tanacetum cinerariifolium]
MKVFIMKMEILLEPTSNKLLVGSYALSWKPCQGDSLNLPDHRGKIDKTVFIRRQKDDILLVQVYVDDIIFGSTKKELCNAFEKMMHEKFQMSSMREHTFFLGSQVKQKQDGIFISQDKYVVKILKKYGFSEVKNASTPMKTQKPLLKGKDREEVDVHMYRSMIGSLMYLISSRPDIMFAVCACARYQVNLKVSHIHAVKRIFRYLKSQPKFGLWYPKDYPFDLVAYTDSDYVRASLDRKSTIGEAKYVAASSCCGQVLWIQNQLPDYGTPRRKDTELPQTSVPTSVADEEMYDCLERAVTIATSLDAEPDMGLGEVDASKQERIINDLDTDEDITLVNDQEMFDADKDLQGEEVVVEQEVVADKEPIVDDVEVSVVATTVTFDDITLAKALEALKTLKPKIRGIVIQYHEDPSELRTTTTTISSKISQDNGKAKMIE